MIAMEITITGSAVHSNPTATPAMMLVAGPVWDASAIVFTGTIFILRVVLSDVNKGLSHHDADDTAKEKIKPSRSGLGMRDCVDGKEPLGRHKKAGDGKKLVT